MSDVKIQNHPSENELNSLGVFQWPIWEKETSSFPWHYDTEEVCYLLEGKVTVHANGKTFEFGKGDLVTFPQGMSCEWIIHHPVKKHYQFR
ncbi:MAG: cupin domain-containing protein [Thiotrichales bacterium]|nr:cupin domain-containing protein [Thiotrichales bacterium]